MTRDPKQQPALEEGYCPQAHEEWLQTVGKQHTRKPSDTPKSATTPQPKTSRRSPVQEEVWHPVADE